MTMINNIFLLHTIFKTRHVIKGCRIDGSTMTMSHYGLEGKQTYKQKEIWRQDITSSATSLSGLPSLSFNSTYGLLCTLKSIKIASMSQLLISKVLFRG